MFKKVKKVGRPKLSKDERMSERLRPSFTPSEMLVVLFKKPSHMKDVEWARHLIMTHPDVSGGDK